MVGPFHNIFMASPEGSCVRDSNPQSASSDRMHFRRWDGKMPFYHRCTWDEWRIEEEGKRNDMEGNILSCLSFTRLRRKVVAFGLNRNLNSWAGWRIQVSKCKPCSRREVYWDRDTYVQIEDFNRHGLAGELVPFYFKRGEPRRFSACLQGNAKHCLRLPAITHLFVRAPIIQLPAAILSVGMSSGLCGSALRTWVSAGSAAVQTPLVMLPFITHYFFNRVLLSLDILHCLC